MDTFSPPRTIMPRIPKISGLQVALGGIVLAVAIAAVFARSGLHAFASHWVGVFRDGGAVPFFAALAVLPSVGFPLSVFLVTAGPVFGPTLGPWHVVAYATLAVSVNLAISYWIAARPLRAFAERLASRRGYRIPRAGGERAWKITLLVRIVPGLPFFFQNCLLGVARVPFGPYLLVSALVQFVYVVGAVLLGNGVLSGRFSAVAPAALLFVLIGVTLHYLRKNWTVGKKTPETGGR
jgi:uncharacterized membrane protein YdjX (TVP38/TMEM64 family)